MTDGFIGKLKLTFSSKERKNEKILRASYRAGKRQAHAELGSSTKDSSSLSALSSDNEQLSHAQGKNSTGTAAPGQTFGSQSDPAAASAAGAALGTGGGAAAGYGALKKGRVVSLPPKRSREPLDKDWGGDYANEKRPEEVTGATGADSSKAVLDNSQPRYDNEASPILGKGKFYDPKDTQGGVYGSSGSNSASGSTSGHGGAYAGAAGAGAAGAGLAYAAGRGGSDSGSGSNEYTEATQQEVSSQDNLKTKPTVYAEQEKQEEEANKVCEQAYAKGQRQAKELHQQGKEKARAEADEGKIGSGVDEQEEHAHNKSAYNQGGVKQAYREVTGGKSDGNKSGSNAGYAAAGAGAGAAGGYAAGSALGSKGSKETQDARSNAVHAGEPPSGDKFDYDSEIKRLDQNIATTQKEIDEIHGRGTLDPRAGATSSSGAVPAPSGSSAPGGSSASKTSSGSGRALAGAGTGAAVGAGAGYAARDRSSESYDQTKATNQPGTSSSTGPSSAGAATGTSRDATTHQSKTEQFKEYYDAGIKKGAYDAGQEAGQGSHGAQGTQDESSGHGPGLVAGAAGAVGAAGVLASRAFGLGGSQDASRESDPQADAQAKQAEIQSKQADAQKESDSQLARSESSSYLDSAKGAIGAAFGYGQGLNDKKDEFTHDSQTTGSKAAHPQAVSTGGDPSLKDPSFRHPETAAAAGSVDTRYDADRAAREAKNAASDKTSQSSGGFLSRFGFGGDNKSETSEREEPTQSSQSGQSGSNSTLGAIAGAVTGGAVGTGASSALGGSSSGAGSEKGNLVETAAANSREVDEQPKHKGNKNATVEAAGDETNKDKDDVQQVPGLEPEDKREDPEKDTKLTASSLAKLEEEVAAHNKKHGIKNDGRSLIDIAEQEDPLILKLHHAKGLLGALDLGDEEESSGAKDDIQPVPDVALHPKSDFINLGGKVGHLGNVDASEATRSETNAGGPPRHRTPH